MRWTFLAFFFLFSEVSLAQQPRYVSYEEKFKGAHRFGDWLIAYIHAKWISYRDKVPLVYRPFSYSSDLILSEKELSLELVLQKGEVPRIHYYQYFPESKIELERQHLLWKDSYFPVDFGNQEFKALLREMIAPKKELQLMNLAKNRINIALHVREGGGLDPKEISFIFPEKLPPLAYYSKALNLVLSFFRDKPIFCHVFTDAQNPKQIVEEIQRMTTNAKEITWSYREKQNHHTKNVLEDFFSLFQFDILIRSESNFSMVPSLIHDYALVCYPIRCRVEQKNIITEELGIKINDGLFQRLLLIEPTER